MVDRQDYWRKLARGALRRSGEPVLALGSYDAAAVERALAAAATDLVVLGCASFGEDERELLARLVPTGVPVLVLATPLSHAMIREIFLLGAADVAEKPFSGPEVRRVVDEAFANLEAVARYSAGSG